ncbi:MAG: formylglycine-generating enzyme family protein, partial [Prochlorotrichaceae cyanobacterium]
DLKTVKAYPGPALNICFYKKQTSISFATPYILAILPPRSPMAPDLSTQPVEILQTTYHLPLLRSDPLQRIQTRLRDRQRIIKTGERPKSFLLGLRTRLVSLSDEERLEEVNAQVTDYQQIITLVTTYKANYQRFLSQLAAELRQTFAQRFQHIQHHETERVQDEANARQRQNPLQIQGLRQEKQQLLEELLFLDHIASLILKQIDQLCQGLDRIWTNTTLQDNIVTELVNDLDVYKRMIHRRQQAQPILEKSSSLAELTLNVDGYIHRYFTPFQDLIGQTIQIEREMGDILQNLIPLAAALGGMTANRVNLEELFPLSEDSAELQNHLGLTDLTLGQSILRRGEGLLSSDTEQDLSQISIDQAIAQLQSHLDRELRKRCSDGALQIFPIPNSTKADGALLSTLSFDLPNNGGTLELIGVPGGTLTMAGGHQVQLQPFLLGKYPVTQRQYQGVMGVYPSNFKGNLDCPVERINWHDAIAFCKTLSQILSYPIDLPSETQWEWAARGATQSQGYTYAGSNILDEVGWYESNSYRTTHPVGQKKPNELGLYDMSGNVWEWCKDHWTAKVEELPVDGTPLTRGGHPGLRLLRGGSWYGASRGCHSTSRVLNNPDNRYPFNGFRVAARSLHPPSESPSSR